MLCVDILTYQVLFCLATGHFHFAKYVDTVIQSRVAALISDPSSQKHASVDEDRRRADAIFRDQLSQSYILMAMRNYIESLKSSSKHVYHALPRLLSLWFELTAIPVPAEKTASVSDSNKRQVTYGSNRRHSGSGTKTTPGKTCIQLPHLFHRKRSNSFLLSP